MALLSTVVAILSPATSQHLKTAAIFEKIQK